MRRIPGKRIEVEWDWRSWTIGFAGPYIGYTKEWANFYIFIGPLELNFDWVKKNESN